MTLRGHFTLMEAMEQDLAGRRIEDFLLPLARSVDQGQP
jgi:hypothetical protein